MCILCLRPGYPEFGLPRDNTVKAKALRIKQDIREHEQIVADAQKRGGDPCPLTLRRLETLRKEQYEVNRLL